MAGEVTRIENIPVEFEIGRPDTVCGFATLDKDLTSGKIELMISLDAMNGAKLESVLRVLELRSIGFFTGKIRRTADGR